MKEKFNWDKFIVDCVICFSIAVVSPFVYSYLIKSDDLRWILYPIKWLLYPIQWILYLIQWFFEIDNFPIRGISELVIGFFSLSIISFFIINIFYKLCKSSLLLSFIFMICYASLANYFFAHL